MLSLFLADVMVGDYGDAQDFYVQREHLVCKLQVVYLVAGMSVSCACVHDNCAHTQSYE